MQLKSRPYRRQRGLSFAEVALCVALLSILVLTAAPLARVSIRRAKEVELRAALRTMRRAIDEYHEMAKAGKIMQTDVSQEFYPAELEELVEGVEIANDPSGSKHRFLRRIPPDPMTGEPEWGLRSYQDDWDSSSWGGENVYDVYSESEALSLDGKTRYNEW